MVFILFLFIAHFAAIVGGLGRYIRPPRGIKTYHKHINTPHIAVSNLILTMSTEAPERLNVAGEATMVVGQEYSGIATRARPYGIIVNISSDSSVFIPKAKVSRGVFEKLKASIARKSTEPVQIKIAAISENGTLSGDFIPPIGAISRDPDLLKSKEWRNRRLNATVVGAHEFGLFAELDEFGVEGLVSPAKIPREMIGGSIKKTFA